MTSGRSELRLLRPDDSTTARRDHMSASFEILMLTAAMTAAEPGIALYQLQENCVKLAVATFNRETGNDEDRVDYRAHYNARLNKCFYAETYISPTPRGINKWGLPVRPARESNLRRVSQVHQHWPFLLQT